jgi:GTPase SAR1 family protein
LRFVGRSQLLAEVEEKLALSGRVQRAAIIGLGGVGKTQIMQELAYRIQHNFPSTSIVSVPALSREAVRKAFFDIGRRLKVLGLEQPKADVCSAWCSKP